MTNEDRQKFWNTLAKLDGKNLQSDIEKLNGALLYPTPLYPKNLFRYRNVNIDSLLALKNNKLYFSSADKYDDPFDTYLKIDWNKIDEFFSINNFASLENFQTLCKSKNWHFSKELTQKVFDLLKSNDYLNLNKRDFIKKIRTILQQCSYSICFSESCLEENLWLKYANNHRGYCIAYNFSDENTWLCGKQENCNQCISNPALTRYGLYPIYYTDKEDEKHNATDYSIALAIHYLLLNNSKQSLIEEFIDAIPNHWEREKISLIKHKCHEYDQEWRLIEGVCPAKPNFIKWKPEAVIIGLRTSEKDKEHIIDCAKSAGIQNICQVGINPEDKLALLELDN